MKSKLKMSLLMAFLTMTQAVATQLPGDEGNGPSKEPSDPYQPLHQQTELDELHQAAQLLNKQQENFDAYLEQLKASQQNNQVMPPYFLLVPLPNLSGNQLPPASDNHGQNH